MRWNISDSIWAKRTLGALAGVLLAAVPALGLTTLGPGFLPLGQLGDVGISLSLFPFDAPTATLQRLRPAGMEHASAAREEAVLLTDWQFTESFQQDWNNLLAADLNYARSFHAGPLVSWLIFDAIFQAQSQMYQNASPAEKLSFLTKWGFMQSLQEDLSAVLAADQAYVQSLHLNQLLSLFTYEQIIKLQVQAYQNLSAADQTLFLILLDQYVHRPRLPQSPHQ